MLVVELCRFRRVTQGWRCEVARNSKLSVRKVNCRLLVWRIVFHYSFFSLILPGIVNLLHLLMASQTSVWGRWRKLCSAHFLGCLLIVQERMTVMGSFTWIKWNYCCIMVPCVLFTALTLMVGWKNIQPGKTPVSLMPRRSDPEEVEEDLRGKGWPRFTWINGC